MFLNWTNLTGNILYCDTGHLFSKLPWCAVLTPFMASIIDKLQVRCTMVHLTSLYLINVIHKRCTQMIQCQWTGFTYTLLYLRWLSDCVTGRGWDKHLLKSWKVEQASCLLKVWVLCYKKILVENNPSRDSCTLKVQNFRPVGQLTFLWLADAFQQNTFSRACWFHVAHTSNWWTHYPHLWYKGEVLKHT